MKLPHRDGVAFGLVRLVKISDRVFYEGVSDGGREIEGLADHHALVPIRAGWKCGPDDGAVVAALLLMHHQVCVATFHDMKLYAGRGRTRSCDVKPSQYQVSKVEREEANDAARQIFSPSHDLMLVVKIAGHPPNTFAVFLSEGVPIWVTDNFQNCFANDLKSVTFQWRR
jgi:hypothetical protein